MPAGQAVQYGMPIWSWYVPGTQSVHSSGVSAATAVLCVPRWQGRQAMDPGVLAYVPEGQGWHSMLPSCSA